MLNFDAFELVDELLPGQHAYDMVWCDAWRGDWVTTLCASVQGLRDDLSAGTPFTFFIEYLGQGCELQGFSDYSLSTSVLHYTR